MYLLTDQRSVLCLEAGGHTVGHDDHKTLGEKTSEVLLIFFIMDSYLVAVAKRRIALDKIADLELPLHLWG